MKKLISIGKSDFKDAIESNNYYIDKNLLIKELINSEVRIGLFLRPRRFGIVDIVIWHKKDKKKPAIIMELKKLEDKTLEETLKQIVKKFYVLDLQNQGYSNIIKIAVVFDGKNINLKFEKN
ncbi:MAG TPA: AAA family ATPase [bacterium]|nr:AAA family ATPase [bacterium]HPP87392.1 AAA family ATPase [bacterium]